MPGEVGVPGLPMTPPPPPMVVEGVPVRSAILIVGAAADAGTGVALFTAALDVPVRCRVRSLVDVTATAAAACGAPIRSRIRSRGAVAAASRAAAGVPVRCRMQTAVAVTLTVSDGPRAAYWPKATAPKYWPVLATAPLLAAGAPVRSRMQTAGGVT